jgi:hypothetical protein
MNDASHLMHATTILMVRKGGRVVIGGDGQVSLGQTIVKGNAKKVRRLAKGSVIGASPARLPTPSPCSSGWRASSSSIRASSPEPASS